jgi:hypothetical protein
VAGPKLAGGAPGGLGVPSAIPHLAAPGRERGAVTAETAVVLPVLVAVTLGLVWLVCLGIAQVRVVDAARETARAVARDEVTGQAIELGKRVAPDGAAIAVHDDGDSVEVVVTADVRGPGGLFGFLPSVEVDARTVSAKEAW